MDYGSTTFDQILKNSTLKLFRQEQLVPNGYNFANNDATMVVDAFGLQSWMGAGYGALSGPLAGGGNGSESSSEPDVQWNVPLCSNGMETKFIQVVISGQNPLYLPNFWTPFVDNNSIIRGTGSRLYYPYWPTGGYFEDTPTHWTETQFEVCRVCICKGKIVSVGPCKHWSAGDTGNLNNFPTYAIPSIGFINAVNSRHPGVLPPIQGDFPHSPAG
jgi:hypothetical protein